MAKLEATPGERAAGLVGAMLAGLLLLICLDLALDGAVLGWLPGPAPAGDNEGEVSDDDGSRF